jgi:type II secretory pathway component PulF
MDGKVYSIEEVQDADKLIAENKASLIDKEQIKVEIGQAMAFIVLALSELVHVFNIRNNKRSIFKTGIGGNNWLFGAIALASALVFVVLLVPGLRHIFGIPVLQDMYASYGLTDQIPEETMAAANFIYWCGDHWYVILAVIVALAIIFNVWKRTTIGKYAWDKFKISMPIFGPLIMRLQVQKFFVAVNINLKNNARLQDAISDCKTVVTNDVLRAAIEAAESNLIVGDSWIEPFEKLKNFPTMIQEMLRIGMETDMPAMIENILNFIDEDIRITIERITKTLPSVSMIFMGIVLIGFVVIILKPIMEVYMGSFLFEANGI